MKNISLTIYQISNFLFKFITLNLLILLFSLVGLIVIGFFPSLASAHAIIRNWIIYKKEPPIFKEFFKYFKMYLLKSNLLGYFMILLIAFFYLDFYFFQTFESSFLNLVSFLYLPLLFLAILTTFYVFPLLVNYNLKMSSVIKNSFLLAIGNPFTSILILIIIAGIWIVIYFVPMLFIFAGFSSTIYTVMYFSHNVFGRLDNKNN
ncbi:YesL family protein [Aquibacillus saliphilus]|uniref:YesL family protein n=1 Tax=Aquibacillus saliphilus TaxID=1909422 RepID=UPI001CF0ABB1|nr:DUF624 domain-containing protein [Aquibacillus saliphilus]